VDDNSGRTLAAADSRSAEFRAQYASGGNVAAAKAVGALLAQRAKEAGISRAVFDRGGFMYHGRVKALAEAARAGGLVF
jgi:large subunit ribosomal protein L18